jgi:hypothetical protein
MELTVAAGQRYWFEVSRQRHDPSVYRGLLTRLSSSDTSRWLQARENGTDIQTYEPR